MDFVSDYTFLIAFLVFIIVVITVMYIRRAWVQRETFRSELKTLTNNEYSVFKGYRISTPEGPLVVEYLIVSVYGVFVVSTSTLKGYIVGDEGQSVWQQKRHGKTIEFESPLLANERVERALRQTLSAYPTLPCVSLVGFPLRTTLAVHATAQVCTLGKLIDVVRSYRTPMISLQEARGVANLLHSTEVVRQSTARVLSDMM